MVAPITTELRKEIRQRWDTMQVRPEKSGDVRWCVNQILKNKHRYQKVETACGVPWWLVAVIHAMECSFRFDTWLANGDKLSDATVRVPKGLRVPEETPPYSWEGAAVRSLKHDKVTEVTDFSLESVLWLLEQWNGLGYRKKGVPSQYIWSFTNHEKPGRYVADGVWNPDAWSGQCGCAAMLCTLALAGEISFGLKPEKQPTVGWFEARLIIDNPAQWEIGVIAKLADSDNNYATLRIPVPMHSILEFQEQFAKAKTTVIAAPGKKWPLSE